MSKKVHLLLFVSFFMCRIFSSEMILTPLVVYDISGNKIDLDENPAETIYKQLKTHWFEGLLKFSYLSDQETGFVYTLMDANALCVSNKKDYLFYGYIQKNEGNWLGNVKLYDAAKKKVIREFYSSDDIEHYGRFIENLKNNIVDGLMNIAGLSNDDLIEEKIRPAELKIPISVYYWSPIDKVWDRVLMGVVGANIGLEFYPSQKNVVYRSKLIDFSILLKFEYDYGKNQKDTYPLNLNTVKVGLPVIFHLHNNTRNTLYTGFGINYGVEMLNYIPKYEDERFLYQNTISGEIIAGYEYNLNRYLNLFSEVSVDIRIWHGNFVSVKPTLGLSINLFKESK